MLTSELPVEITLLFTRYLNPKDKIQCCLVCKNWLRAFQETVFETIIIESIVDFNHLTAQTNTGSNVLQIHGHDTRTLEIGKNVFLNSQELYALQQHLPNLQNFKWDNSQFREFLQPPDTYGWNLWAESLVDLDVSLESHTRSEQTKIFDLIRSNLCRLKRLKLSSSGHIAILTFDDCELLNDQLPELTYMSLRARFKEMSYDKLSKVKEVKPRPCFKTLKMDIRNSTHEWMYYIAAKYPNISTIQSFYFQRSKNVDPPTSQALSLLAELPRPLQQLETIFMSVEATCTYIYRSFVSQLYAFNIPVKKIELGVNSGWTLKNPPREHRLVTTELWANTLEKVSIAYYTGCSHFFCFCDDSVYYPRLVYLNISVCGASVLLNIVLTNCPSLMTLKVAGNTLENKSNPSTPSIKHGLRDLSLMNEEVSANTLNYISTNCNDLKKMLLDCVTIIGSQRISNYENCIDMSSTHFSKLYIRHIQYTPYSKGHAIEVFVFIPSPENEEEIRSPIRFCTENACVRFSAGVGANGIRLGLGTQKMREKYFSTFSDDPRSQYRNDQCLKVLKRMSLDRREDTIYHLYVTFKYGSVQDFVFDD
ncbi:hypothetical protein F4703DRAFT_1916606 [Phycomyces blakesleeanus]